jgi:hypothetical protein
LAFIERRLIFSPIVTASIHGAEELVL